MTEDFIQNVQFDLFSVELVIEDTATLSLAEDFIQNVQFDIFSVQLVIGETATLLMAEDYVTIREVFVDNVKVKPNENKQIFFTSGVKSHPDLENKNAEPEFQHVTQEEKTGFHTHNNKEYLDNYNPALFATALQGEKADSALQSLPPNTVIDADYPALKDKVNGIEENANKYIHPDKHPTSILEGIDTEQGDENTFLNKKGEFTKPTISHSGVTNKNAETTFQHIDTTTTKQTLVQADKVPIYDSVTGKIVLTNKSNVGGGSTSDIISTNVTNNSGTIVIDTTPNWQRVNISSGGTLILDYPNGILPTKNREYLLVINNASTTGITLTLPTVSFVKGGITYNFINTAVTFPINSGRSIEVNVIFFFIDATTCNIRTLITPFI